MSYHSQIKWGFKRFNANSVILHAKNVYKMDLIIVYLVLVIFICLIAPEILAVVYLN